AIGEVNAQVEVPEDERQQPRHNDGAGDGEEQVAISGQVKPEHELLLHPASRAGSIRTRGPWRAPVAHVAHSFGGSIISSSLFLRILRGVFDLHSACGYDRGTPPARQGHARDGALVAWQVERTAWQAIPSWMLGDSEEEQDV